MLDLGHGMRLDETLVALQNRGAGKNAALSRLGKIGQDFHVWSRDFGPLQRALKEKPRASPRGRRDVSARWRRRIGEA
ncbi:hypothetical protein, partial [Mesorhizobium sp.]|uniref:hypothetical protein n=1 Tax=Mesorhizobium sp. TaxID=1871066 RepID=UPI00257AD626